MASSDLFQKNHDLFRWVWGLVLLHENTKTLIKPSLLRFSDAYWGQLCFFSNYWQYLTSSHNTSSAKHCVLFLLGDGWKLGCWLADDDKTDQQSVWITNTGKNTLITEADIGASVTFHRLDLLHLKTVMKMFSILISPAHKKPRRKSTMSRTFI